MDLNTDSFFYCVKTVKVVIKVCFVEKNYAIFGNILNKL